MGCKRIERVTYDFSIMFIFLSALTLEEQNFLFSRKTGRRSFGNFNPYIEKLYSSNPEELAKLPSESEYKKLLSESSKNAER